MENEMTKSKAKWIGLFLLPFLSGCSWLPWFVIANKTTAPILVEYTLAGEGRLAPCPGENGFVMKPRVTTEKMIGEQRVDQLPEAQYVCDSKNRKVSLHLNPEEAVYLFEVPRYHGFRKEEDFRQYTFMEYPVTSIAVESKMGRVEYKGTQVPRDFAKRNNSLYVLTFE